MVAYTPKFWTNSIHLNWKIIVLLITFPLQPHLGLVYITKTVLTKSSKYHHFAQFNPKSLLVKIHDHSRLQWLYVGQTPPKIAELSQFAMILYTVRTPQHQFAQKYLHHFSKIILHVLPSDAQQRYGFQVSSPWFFSVMPCRGAVAPWRGHRRGSGATDPNLCFGRAGARGRRRVDTSRRAHGRCGKPLGNKNG